MGRVRFNRAITPAVVGGAALATAAAVAFTTTVPQVLSREKVELTATVTPGSATNWNADGIDRFYGIDWNATYGPTAIAPFRLVEFWQGAKNILNALTAAQGDGFADVVVSSGRGAGNASAAITWLALTNPTDPRLTDTFWILDNNVDRPNGGYATRYPFFAFVGVNPVPVPNNLGVQILDVGYEYAWNSSAPAYVSNLPSLLNAIIAYAYRYRQQERLPIPGELLNADGTLNQEYLDGQTELYGPGYYVVRIDGTLERRPFDDPDSDVTTTYLTYETDGLPMLKPIRDFGGDLGNAFADVVEPLMTVLVNASYTDNDPLADPSVYTPLQLVAPPDVWIRAAQQLPGAVSESWERLQEHLGGAPAQDTEIRAADTEAHETVSAGTEAEAEAEASNSPTEADRPTDTDEALRKVEKVAERQAEKGTESPDADESGTAEDPREQESADDEKSSKVAERVDDNESEDTGKADAEKAQATEKTDKDAKPEKDAAADPE